MSENPVLPVGRIDLILDELNRQRFANARAMQCKVCWYVYDPTIGCEEWDIEPGTSFNDLPEHFTCPQCGNDKSVFLPCEKENRD